MVDDVVVNKVASIERCVARAFEEYQDKEAFWHSYTQQDAAILNIQRACESALDLGQHIIRKYRLGLPQSARSVFQLLKDGGWLSKPLCQSLQRMVGFRNIAMHEYQSMQLAIVVRVIESHLDDFLQYAQAVLQQDQAYLTGKTCKR